MLPTSLHKAIGELEKAVVILGRVSDTGVDPSLKSHLEAVIEQLKDAELEKLPTSEWITRIVTATEIVHLAELLIKLAAS